MATASTAGCVVGFLSLSLSLSLGASALFLAVSEKEKEIVIYSTKKIKKTEEKNPIFAYYLAGCFCIDCGIGYQYFVGVLLAAITVNISILYKSKLP
jgi:hypothetical protein